MMKRKQARLITIRVTRRVGAQSRSPKRTVRRLQSAIESSLKNAFRILSTL